MPDEPHARRGVVTRDEPIELGDVRAVAAARDAELDITAGRGVRERVDDALDLLVRMEPPKIREVQNALRSPQQTHIQNDHTIQNHLNPRHTHKKTHTLTLLLKHNIPHNHAQIHKPPHNHIKQTLLKTPTPK